MQSTDLQVLAAARRWAAEGRRFALVTVARIWGSAPRPPGAWLALREDGLVEGSVSGGCIEDDLIARMREGRLAGAAPFKLVYGVTKEEATRFGLSCGGTLELVVEPAPDAALLEALKSPAFYVGAVGSRLNNARRRERLARVFLDLSEAELARLHGPVGLPIGSRTPPEIAVAILAEMTAVKNGVAVPLRDANATLASGTPACAAQ